MSFLGKFADSIKKFNADGKVYQIISGTFSLALLCATLIAVNETHQLFAQELFTIKIDITLYFFTVRIGSMFWEA